MMKNKFSKLTSLLLILSFVVTLFAVYPVAETEDVPEDESNINVIYNRHFEEGWDYTNGMSASGKNGQSFNINYEQLSASRYNYFLKVSALNDGDGYLSISTGDKMTTSGKLYFEIDISVSEGNNFGGVIVTACPGTGTERKLNYLVRFDDGELYLLGQKIGKVSKEWLHLGFTFDFDYALNTLDADDKEYQVTASYGDGASVSGVFKTGNAGFGVSDVFIGLQDNYYGTDRSTDYYYADNIKLYTGTDGFSELPDDDYGYAVDSSLARTIEILGIGSSDKQYVSGSQEIPREAKDYELYIQRYFSEGWDFQNGFTSIANIKNNDFHLTYDYSTEINKGGANYVNYYLQCIALNNENGFIAVDTNSCVPKGSGKVYMEFDLKANAGCDVGGFMTWLTPGADSNKRTQEKLVGAKGGQLYVLDTPVGAIGDEWVHIAVEFNFDYATENPDVYERTYLVTAYYGTYGKIVKEYKIKDFDDSFFGLLQIRIGFDGVGGSVIERSGEWFAFDNYMLYSTDGGFANIPENDYGFLVNEEQVKDFSMDNIEAEVPPSAIIDSYSYLMKVASDYALNNGKRVPIFTDSEGNIYGAPKKIDGQVMIPLAPLLDYMGATYRTVSDGLGIEFFTGDNVASIAVGRNSAMVNNEEIRLSTSPIVVNGDGYSYIMIALDDFEKIVDGYYVTYDTVGFIGISKYDDFISRDIEGGQTLMMEAMKKYLFSEWVDQQLFYETVKENTNNFDHPYIMTNQAKFDELYEKYHMLPTDDGFDPTIIGYIDELVKHADEQMKRYALLDEYGDYVRLLNGHWEYNEVSSFASWVTSDTDGDYSIANAPYPNSGGYDPAGGRLNVLSDGTWCIVAALKPCAFAYQVTHDEKYVRFAYDWTVALCSWPHWGPGHFLNCAQTSGPLSTSYDWLYDAYVELFGQEATDWIATKIFENGVYEGWRSVKGLPVEHVRAQGDASQYHIRTNNWNPVCALGMLSAGLSVMDHEEYVDQATYLITDNMYHLPRYGLTYIYFDGSYAESSGYWTATANRFFQIGAILEHVVDTDYGILDGWGLDITSYYGCHFESSNFDSWNYHDDSMIALDSSWYYYIAKHYENNEFAALRKAHIENGKSVDYMDCFFYDPTVFEGEAPELGLEYFFDGIHAGVMRDSWEPNSLFAGLMGGANNAPHGNIDSGNWIYENAGIRWFVDLGMGEYNTYNHGSKYYKYNAEGQNVLLITSHQDTIQYGQVTNAIGKLIKSGSNKHGAYTIIDNTDAYGNFAEYAYRGMLVTNDRKTVVIQDEVSFKSIESAYWFAHFNRNTVPTVEISPDGKTAYMTSAPDRNGETKTLRVSLVSANRSFKFEVWTTHNADDLVLDATARPGWSESMGGTPEHNRTSYKKLVINCGEGVLSFNVAVVIELIDPDEELEVGYKLGWNNNAKLLRPMSTWEPAPDFREVAEDEEAPTEEKEELRGRPTVSAIRGFTIQLENYYSAGTHFSTNLLGFYQALTSSKYIVDFYGEDGLSDMAEYLSAYEGYKEIYDDYQNVVDKGSTGAKNIVSSMLNLNLN